MSNLTILYTSAILLQLGATVLFIMCSKLLGLSRANPFTIAFGLIFLRRLIVQFFFNSLPGEIRGVVIYLDVYILPIAFSFLLFIGTAQFYAKLTKYLRKEPNGRYS